MSVPKPIFSINQAKDCFQLSMISLKVSLKEFKTMMKKTKHIWKAIIDG